MDFAEGCLQTRNMDLRTCVWLPIVSGGVGFLPPRHVMEMEMQPERHSTVL
jgi:hypothetical protein